MILYCEHLLHERQGTVRKATYGMDGHDVLNANNFSSDRDRLYGDDNGDEILTVELEEYPAGKNIGINNREETTS